MLPISVHNELAVQDRAILLDVLMFADLDVRQATNPEVNALREISLKIRSDTLPKDLCRDFSRLFCICTSALEKLRTGAWKQACGLDWGTYLLFNRIVNNGADTARHIQGKLYGYLPEEELDDIAKEVSESGEKEGRTIAFQQR